MAFVGAVIISYITSKIFGQQINILLGKLTTIILCVFMVSAIGVLICADTIGGYAIYADRLIARVPFVDSKPLTYQLTDIDHIEVGCQVRLLGLGRHGAAFTPIPTYDLHMRNGRVYPLSHAELGPDSVRRSKLAWAIVTLDNNVRTTRISRQLVALTADDQYKLNDCLQGYADSISFHDQPEIIRAYSVK